MAGLGYHRESLRRAVETIEIFSRLEHQDEDATKRSYYEKFLNRFYPSR